MDRAGRNESAGDLFVSSRSTADVRLLTILIWLGGLLFAAAIVALYPIASLIGRPDDWNIILSNLHVPGSPVANGAIMIHFLLGAFLMCAGPIQLWTRVRRCHPRFHRLVGWLYAPAAFLTGLAGSLFILIRGTIGGAPMTVGFLCYGILMMVVPIQSVRMAVAKRFAAHRAWAIRLYALVISSMLYRADYFLWGMIFRGLGMSKSYSGPFDYFMDFAFFVVPLSIAEFIVRRPATLLGADRMTTRAAIGRWIFVLYLIAGLGLLTTFTWGPIILWRLEGSP